nr:MAG TPA: hypothetical protein [Caudoviricetes sp.]
MHFNKFPSFCNLNKIIVNNLFSIVVKSYLVFTKILSFNKISSLFSSISISLT